MAQAWRKLGLVFSPRGSGWMTSHAQNPMPVALPDGNIRVYFTSRDGLNRSRGGYFDFSLNDPTDILATSPSPILDLGELGCFDDSGVMPSSLISFNGKNYLYYTGWSRTVDVPFAFHIGLAEQSADGSKFVRVSKAPVLGRNHFDPFITGAPFVLEIDGQLKMWYISGTKWEKSSPEAKPVHYYTVKSATSADGIHWLTNERICIPFAAKEYAIARPVVFAVEDGYEMWFSYRGGDDTYRMGRAVSKDACDWVRVPEGLQIAPSKTGWDSQMLCYPYPFRFQDKLYAFYNGNNYGATGVGIAVLE